jgi:hypothetical protein
MRHLSCLLAILLSGIAALGQGRPQPAPTILMGPADWRFERLPIPPGFAPDIKWKGYEEARFAPGMFSTTSSNYFTYVLAVSLDGTPEVGAADLKEFLEKYFRGLSIGVGQRKQLKPDPSQFVAEVSPAKTADAKGRYEAKMTFFDTFNEGQKVLLNLEARVAPQPDQGKTFVVLLISPLGKDAGTWAKLREIGDKLTFEAKPAGAGK